MAAVGQDSSSVLQPVMAGLLASRHFTHLGTSVQISRKLIDFARGQQSATDGNSYSFVCPMADWIVQNTCVPSLLQLNIRECTNPTESSLADTPRLRQLRRTRQTRRLRLNFVFITAMIRNYSDTKKCELLRGRIHQTARL